jgi:hypothetical protein
MTVEADHTPSDLGLADGDTLLVSVSLKCLNKSMDMHAFRLCLFLKKYLSRTFQTMAKQNLARLPSCTE